MTTLKIDPDARRDDRRRHLARIMHEAVWGTSNSAVRMRGISAGVAAWLYRHNSVDAIIEAVDVIAESAELGLIHRTLDGRWKPSRDVAHPRKDDA